MKPNFLYHPWALQALCIVAIMISADVAAQQQYSLAQCVDIAQRNNLEVQSLQLNGQRAQINARQARSARLPNLNFNTQYGWNFGRVVDPTTNIFSNQSSSIQTYSLSSNVNIYQGGLIRHSIDQAHLSESAADLRVSALKDNVALRVAQQYLNALLAQEAVKTAELQIGLTDDNLARVDALVEAGSAPANDRLEVEAQRATNEEELVNALNNFRLAEVQLVNLMQLPPDTRLDLEMVDIDAIGFDEDILEMTADQIYRRALQTQPAMKADSLDLLVSDKDIAISKARLRPTIGAGGSVTSNYSSLAQHVTGSTTTFNDIPVQLGGDEVILGFPTTTPMFSERAYLDQLDDNLGFGLGVNLSLPIFNNLSARSDYQRAELGYQQRRLENDLNRQSLLNDIQTALTSARAGKARYASAQKRIEAQEVSYEMMARRVELGAGNSFDLINVQNNLKVAQLNLIQARYDYLFRLKVLDFYLGNPIR